MRLKAIGAVTLKQVNKTIPNHEYQIRFCETVFAAFADTKNSVHSRQWILNPHYKSERDTKDRNGGSIWEKSTYCNPTYSI